MNSWRIEIKSSAEKRCNNLDAKTRQGKNAALRELESEENPLSHPQMRPLTGKLKGDYRLKVSDWRVLFTPDKRSKILYVVAILPREEQCGKSSLQLR